MYGPPAISMTPSTASLRDSINANSSSISSIRSVLSNAAVINTAALESTDRIELIDELFAFMLSRKEAVEGVIEIAGGPYIYAYANYYPVRYGYFRLGLPWRLERPK